MTVSRMTQSPAYLVFRESYPCVQPISHFPFSWIPNAASLETNANEVNPQMREAFEELMKGTNAYNPEAENRAESDVYALDETTNRTWSQYFHMRWCQQIDCAITAIALVGWIASFIQPVLDNTVHPHTRVSMQ